jgi:hypothetical protein
VEFGGSAMPSPPQCGRPAAAVPWLVAAVLGACSAPTEPADPYRPMVEQAAAQVTSDFERAVLADHKVTRGEYEEAVARYLRCANDQGVALSTIRQAGYYNYTFPQSAEAERIVTDCVRGTTELIEPIFVATLTNPNGEDLDDLIAECVVRKGLASPGYTGADIKAEKRAAIREKRGIDFPFDEEDERFTACVADPSR